MRAARKLISPALIFFALAAEAAPRTAEQLSACLAANAPQGAFEQALTVSRSETNGLRRSLSATVYWQPGSGQSDVLFKIARPPELSGSAYLIQQRKGREAFHVYLPAVGKPRQVNGAGLAQSLFGSGLSAFDLKFIVSGTRGGKLIYAGDGFSVSGRKAEFWRYAPPQGDPTLLYDRAELMVDVQWCLPLEARLFGGVPWKVLSLDAKSVRASGMRWVASRATIRDLRDGSVTTVELAAEKSVQQFAPALFGPKTFYR